MAATPKRAAAAQAGSAGRAGAADRRRARARATSPGRSGLELPAALAMVLLLALAFLLPKPAAAVLPDDLSNFAGRWPCDAQVLRGLPKNIQDIQHLVLTYDAVRAVGAGHSWASTHFCAAGPQPLRTPADPPGPPPPKAVNILMQSVSPLRIWLDENERTVTADAGVTTRYLLDWLAGYTPSYTLGAFPWYINQTVGGAIATGTHGSSLTYGSMSNQVVRLTAVLANGTLAEFSADSHPGLFRAFKTSVGRLGVVTSVTFAIVPNVPVQRTTRQITFGEFAHWMSATLEAAAGRGACAADADVRGCAQAALASLDDTSGFCQLAALPLGMCNVVFFERRPDLNPPPWDCALHSSDVWCAQNFTQGGPPFPSRQSQMPPEGWPVPHYAQSADDQMLPAEPPPSTIVGLPQLLVNGRPTLAVDPNPTLLINQPLWTLIFTSAQRNHVVPVIGTAREVFESISQSEDLAMMSLSAYDQYEASIPWELIPGCMAELNTRIYGENLFVGFRDPANFRIVGRDDTLLSHTHDGPRLFVNIEDWLKYNQNGLPNQAFQTVWHILRGDKCRSRLHWGKAGQVEPQCFNGAVEYGRSWCSFGCAVRELDPAGKFASAGAAYWSWAGVNLAGCCGPDGQFSDACECTVARAPCPNVRYMI